MTQKFKRGDIIRVDFGEAIGHVQGGIRPALVLQNDKGNYYSPTLQVAPLTSQDKNKLPTHIDLDTSCGLSRPSTVLLEQIRVIDKEEQVMKYIGHVDIDKMMEIRILIAFGCLYFLDDKFKRLACL